MLETVKMPAEESGALKRSTSSVRTVLILVAATALNYMVWLGWDRQMDVNPVTHRESGPAEPWQDIGAVAVLALLGGVAAWRRRPQAAVVVIPVTFTVCWSVGASTINTMGANFWPIGAVGVASASAVVTGLAVVAVHAIRLYRDR